MSSSLLYLGFYWTGFLSLGLTKFNLKSTFLRWDLTLLLTFLRWTLLNFRFFCLFGINFLWIFIAFKIFDIFLRLVLFIFGIRFWILFHWNFLRLFWILFLILTNNRLWFSCFFRLFFSVLIIFRIFSVLHVFLVFR